MKNPLIVLRMEAGFRTPADFAEKLKVHVSAVERIEYGMNTSIPEHYIDALEEVYPSILKDTGYSRESLAKTYNHFQRLTRLANYGTLTLNPDFYAETDTLGEAHPFTLWRAQSGVDGLNYHSVCRAYCINYPQLRQFEIRPWLFNKPLIPLVKALEDSGYSKKIKGGSLLALFTEAFLTYRLRLITQSKEDNGMLLEPEVAEV